MTLQATHTHYGVYLNGGSPVLLGSITRQNIASQSQINGEVTSGQIYRSFLALYSQKLLPGFSTYDLAAGLGSIGVLGLSLATLTSGLEFFAQKNLQAGTRATGANHRKFAFRSGIVVPRRLSVDHQGDAVLDYEIVVTYDGVNDPIVVTDSVSLPAGITDNVRYTLAGTTIGGVTVAAKTRMSIEFGVGAEGRAADSDIWDTFATIKTVQPSITIESLDVELLKAANIPLTGKAATHATTAIYFRKRAAGGTGFVADATAQHVRLTADGLIVPDDAFSSDGQSEGKVSFTMPLRYDGTNVPLTVNTASAIA